jgi:hypothetical protein
MSGALALIIWFICIGISAILIGYFLIRIQDVPKKEGFTMLVCPSNSVSYITRTGETECCNGDILDGYCNGNVLCSLSPKNSKGLKTCSDLLVSTLATTGAIMCPPTIPNYFASLNGSVRGCSVSQPLPNGIGPSDPNQLQCILYPTPDLDKVRLDSCYNYSLQLTQKAQLAQCSPSTNLQAQAQAKQPQAPQAQVKQAQTSPTGYYLLPGSTRNDGTDISGELPVTKIIDQGYGKLYLTQDGQYIKYGYIHHETGVRTESYILPGNLSNMPDIDSIFKAVEDAYKNNSLKVGPRDYKIKKPDGTIL